MHIPDGMMSGAVNGAATAASLALVGAALWRGEERIDERRTPLLAMTSAFIFAAQMLNFPVAAGTSGHLLGAALAVLLVGPLPGALVLAVVLGVQCLGFADGGLSALGTNIFNMAGVGGLSAWLLLRLVQAILPKTRWAFLSAAAIAAWGSVVLASAACALELWASGRVSLTAGLTAMTGVHALIGVGEAIITVSVLSVVTASRPELVWALPAEAPAESAGAGAVKEEVVT